MASVKDFSQNLRISKENLQFSRLKLFYDVIMTSWSNRSKLFWSPQILQMTVINRAKFHHFQAKDTKVIDGGQHPPPPQADSVLKLPGEIGLMTPTPTTSLQASFTAIPPPHPPPFPQENFNNTPAGSLSFSTSILYVQCL